MRTSEEVYHRVRWDPRFDPARFVLGVTRRGTTPKRVPLPSFVPGGEIPWHRIVFIEADGELVWDRATGVDRVGASQAGRVRDPRLLRAPYFTARTPFAWDPAAAAWRPAPGDDSAFGPASPVLRVLTWNTLWDRYDSDRIDTDRRRPLLIAALEAESADVIALQEVEPALLTRLLRTDWVRAGYTLHTDPSSGDIADNGLALLSRLPVRESAVHAFGPHKAVVAATVRTASGPLVVATTHLTSDHADRGPARREAELADLAEGLAALDGDVVLVGDFNTGDDAADGGPAAVLGMRDAWTDVHGPHDRTPTFDPGANPLAAVSSLSGRASRLDRVLLRATEPADGAAPPQPTAAVLLGDTPEPDGLHISDHYGVRVDFAPADTASGDVLASAPSARTAVAWLPPPELWPPLQEIRRAHDPGVDRWPPHVNVLFGFVPEDEFDRATPLLAAAAAEIEPFTAVLRGVHTFGHRSDATVWLDPVADGGDAWAALRHALVRRFPGCRGRAEGYTPHLTLGRSGDPQRVAAESAARLDRAGLGRLRVGELALLSRRGDEPMCVRAVFALGTGEVRRVDEASDEPLSGTDPGRRTVRRIVDGVAEALPGGVVHVVGSRRMGCALPGADLDLVAAVPYDAGADTVGLRTEGRTPPERGPGRDTRAASDGSGTTARDLAHAHAGGHPLPRGPVERAPHDEPFAAGTGPGRPALGYPGDPAQPEAAPDSVVTAPHRRAADSPATTGATGTTPGDTPAPPPGDLRARLVAALPEAAPARDVVGARVPGLRFAVDGTRVDLAVVPADGVPPAQAVARRAELGDAAALALSAVDDADAVLAATRGLPAFPGLARRVKAWARTRGLDAAPFGGLPGLAWTLLAARTTAENPGLAGDELLREFFATWAAWDWAAPITLVPGAADTAAPSDDPRPAAPVTVLTPTAPVRNCAEQVGPGGRDLLAHEFYRAWEILDAPENRGAAAPPDLLAAPDLHRRHAAWAVVTVRADAGPDAAARLDATIGRVRGRIRALLTALEEAGAVDAHAWPRPFPAAATGKEAHDDGRRPARVSHAIGLGRTPPSAEQVARIAGSWAAGLPGVTVAWARNGDVPTLR
ncbi:RNA repair domain-containing protein [Yinghuangia sp. ASG 101]|uniref:poly(A) polymerase n=1 Tax=Yinghuangia sp. ASG 101 TaxID=2896848 RepID=UPI001E2B526B|nr:poly(A) polymerase [Yinghuangia sp. ASG 101]UGQ12632.1 RNA repair domain-containing protein [Yinghuangia sp. ASG 101]